MRELIGLLLRYGLVGALNTAVGFAVIVVLDLGAGLAPALANAGGYAAGFVVGYGLNRAFVFRSKAAHSASGPKYLAAAIIAFALNQAVLRAAGALLGTGRPQHLAAQALAMGGYTLALFLLCRLWVFRSAPQPAAAR